MYESKGFWRFSVGTGTKEDESSTVYIWAGEFNQVTVRSRLAGILKLMNRLFNFPVFFSGRGKLQITKTTATELLDMEAQLKKYICTFCFMTSLEV
jgi:hypothetical protein